MDGSAILHTFTTYMYDNILEIIPWMLKTTPHSRVEPRIRTRLGQAVYYQDCPNEIETVGKHGYIIG